MSRKGKLPVAIPSQVKVNIGSSEILIEGPKGKLSQAFDAKISKVFVDDEGVKVESIGDSTLSRAMRGTLRALINNMVSGVQTEYFKDLEIVGVGFKAIVNGKILDLSLGYSHPIKYEIPNGIEIVVKENTKIHIQGISKKMVGQVAADIKNYYPVEPYKGKGVRIVNDGTGAAEFVRRKEGKKTA